jgi:predicted nucleic-acid-binding Zn-ribbon protein
MDKKYKTHFEQKNEIPDKEVYCPKCETKMIEGYIIEPDTPLTILTLFQHLYWSPYVDGRITSRIMLNTFACPNCGYTETYLYEPKQLQKKVKNLP